MTLFTEEPLPFQGQEIRGLSFWQPFASAMIYGKDETRTWPTKYRGLVLICSTLKPTNALIYYDLVSGMDHIRLRHMAKQEADLGEYDTFKLCGYAIAIGRLKRCVIAEEHHNTFVRKAINRGEKLFVHEYEKVKRIEPFKVKGSQGWFKITDEQRKQIILI